MLLCSSMQEFQHTSVLLSLCSNVPHSNVYCSLFGALAAPVFWSLVFWCSKTPHFHCSNVPCSLFRCWGVLCSSAPIFCVLLFQCSILPFSSALVFWCFFCSVPVFQHSKALWCSGVPSIPFTLFGIFLFQCSSVPVFQSSVFHCSDVPGLLCSCCVPMSQVPCSAVPDFPAYSGVPMFTIEVRKELDFSFSFKICGLAQ